MQFIPNSQKTLILNLAKRIIIAWLIKFCSYQLLILLCRIVNKRRPNKKNKHQIVSRKRAVLKKNIKGRFNLEYFNLVLNMI